MGRSLLNHDGTGDNKKTDSDRVGGTIRLKPPPYVTLMEKLRTRVDESFLPTGAEKKLDIFAT